MEWEAAQDQDEQQQRSNDQREKARQSLRVVEESLLLARETAQQLSIQSETLDHSEQLVDEGQYMIDRSKRVVRGMTWTGWLANMVTTSNSHQPHDTGKDSTAVEGFICPECKQVFRSADILMNHFHTKHDDPPLGGEKIAPVDLSTTRTYAMMRRNNPPTHKPRSSSPREDQQSTDARSSLVYDDNGLNHEQRSFLNAIQPRIAELKEVGMVIGDTLEGQSERLDRIDRKTENATHDMKKVTIAAARLSSSRQMRAHFQFRVAFQERRTQMFLQPSNSEVHVKARVISKHAIYRAFTLGDNTGIWGFQNEVTREFLGLDKWGNLRNQGQYLQSYEQFSVDIQKPFTTLYSFASYFGLGGWVCFDLNSSGLYLIRGTAENQHRACEFKIVRIDSNGKKT